MGMSDSLIVSSSINYDDMQAIPNRPRATPAEGGSGGEEDYIICILTIHFMTIHPHDHHHVSSRLIIMHHS